MYGIRSIGPPAPCSYLPGRLNLIEHVACLRLAPEEYERLLTAGWRRFGRSVFRPVCRGCRECRSVRIDVSRFQAGRSQRRAWAANADDVTLDIGPPTVDPEVLDIFRRFHASRAVSKGWNPEPDTPEGHSEMFVDNPFPIEEWRYSDPDGLFGVGYVDAMPVGLSAVYFAHDPSRARRSPGTFNVLSLVEAARSRGMPHVYLGYYVAGCASLEYKARFRPCEVLGEDGSWRPFEP